VSLCPELAEEELAGEEELGRELAGEVELGRSSPESGAFSCSCVCVRDRGRDVEDI
jgi:hypothetical protein